MVDRLRILAAAAALAALTGCPSISTMGTARTIPQGTTQVLVSGAYSSLQDFAISDGKPETVSVPSFELGARLGVNDWMDVGGKVYTAGAQVDAKFQLHRSQTPTRGFDLAISPAVSFYPYSGGVYGWGQLAVPLGFNIGGGDQLVLSPRAAYLAFTAKDGSGHALYAGGSLGYAFRVGRGGLQLLPEVSVAVPMSKKLPTSVEAKFALEGPIYQAGVGFLFGP
jgi:hypothetical protein